MNALKALKNSLINFLLEINQYKDQNKNKKAFLKDIKKYRKYLADQNIKKFMKNNLIFDEESKKDFSENLEKKLYQELVRYNKEIDKITEEKFENDLGVETNKFIESLKDADYSNNYYKFFDDVDTFKEKNMNINSGFSCQKSNYV